MATYKVIQDIEAEDKLLGPLTLRQFIYLAIAGVCGWLSFMSVVKHVPLLLVLLVPIALVAGFLAFPWGGDQSTEIWAVAKLRFMLKPRKRIWDQDGQLDLVKIMVPKRIEKIYTDGLSQNEVKSRLSALASTLDTRGWALQNQPHQVAANQNGDRLFGVSTTLPQPVIAAPVRPQDDMLDPQSNPTASHLNHMIDNATKAQRQALLDQLSNKTPVTATSSSISSSSMPIPSNDWFSPRQSTAIDPDTAAKTTPETEASRIKVSKAAQSPQKTQTQATSTSQTAIINLASNDDLDIATLSRQANKQKPLGEKSSDDGEVVISLR